ncbi:MAG: ABC transporter permease, partial [Terriglobales bacterium]
GMSAPAARQAAARDLGPLEGMKERYRDRLAPRWLEVLGQDLRFAFRQMRRAPLFAALAIISLAIGIGANTTVFNWLDGALLRPLPVEQPGQLAAVWRTNPDTSESFSFPELKYLSHCPAISGVAAFGSMGAMMGSGAHSRMVFDFEVGENYFRLVRPHFILGRGFKPQEDGPGGGQPVAVVTYRFWRDRLGGDPHVLGRTLLLNRIPFTIVGVTGPGFIGTERIINDGLFLPLAMIGPGHWRTEWGNESLWNVVRLKPGVSLGQARAVLAAWLVHAAKKHPQSFTDGARLGLAPPGLMDPDTRNDARVFALVLLAAAGLVLLLACANLAGLWLARGLARRRETAIRLALGCSRRRLIAQHLTETFLLAIFGAAGGLALAEWADHAVLSLSSLSLFPLTLQLGMDWLVLAFTAAVTILAALLCGVLPAWRAIRADPAREFAGGAGAGGARHPRWRGGLIGFQVALAVIAAIFAGLMLRSLGVIAGENPGFQPRNVLQANFDIGEQGLSQAQGREFQNELLARARRLPGVTSASLGEYV